jgi:hypothetical protein
MNFHQQRAAAFERAVAMLATPAVRRPPAIDPPAAAPSEPPPADADGPPKDGAGGGFYVPAAPLAGARRFKFVQVSPALTEVRAHFAGGAAPVVVARKTPYKPTQPRTGHSVYRPAAEGPCADPERPDLWFGSESRLVEYLNAFFPPSGREPFQHRVVVSKKRARACAEAEAEAERAAAGAAKVTQLRAAREANEDLRANARRLERALERERAERAEQVMGLACERFYAEARARAAEECSAELRREVAALLEAAREPPAEPAAKRAVGSKRGRFGPASQEA